MDAAPRAVGKPGRTAGVTTAAVLAVGAALYERRATRRRDREQRRFRLRAGERLPDGLARVLTARLDDAIRALESPDGDWSEGVHDARTSVKRVRTVLRLAREQPGGSRYREENDALRSASRRLAPLRDAMVLPDVLDALVRRYPAAVDPREVADLAAALEARRGAVRQPDAHRPAIEEAAASLRAVREQVELSSGREIGLPALARGLRRVLSRGRRGYRQALADGDAEALHAWRKRVKDLRYAAELLREADPSRLKPLRQAAHELSDLLGDDHDLAVLAGHAGGCPSTSKLISRRRRELQATALELAPKLYARPPRRVARRLRRRARKRTAWG
jgi:CHAD domain-containing protein